MPFYPPNSRSRPFQSHPRAYHSHSPQIFRNAGPRYHAPRYIAQDRNPMRYQEGFYPQKQPRWGELNQIMIHVGDLSNGIHALRQIGSFFNSMR